MIANVLREFATVDKGFPVFNIRTLESRIDDSLSKERMVASFAAAFGGLALLLVGVGLYGILAYSVSCRTREIGIRMALGSTLSGVLGLIAREALTLVGSGALAGIIIALLSNQLLVHFFPGVSALNAQTLAASAGVMFAVAALAVSVPAYRAARIDPVIALRHE
jgi:ABC-type antimicrobial peptide transport system permease subunit